MATNNESPVQALDNTALATFPKTVYIRGNNAKFMRVWQWTNGNQHLRFDSQSGPTATRFEIHPAGNGMVRIRSPVVNAYWRCNADNWILVNAGNIPEPDTLFQLVKLQIGPLESYAIKSVHSNLYITKFLSNPTLGHFVARATSSTIVSDAVFQVYGVNNFNYSNVDEATQEKKEAQPN